MLFKASYIRRKLLKECQLLTGSLFAVQLFPPSPSGGEGCGIKSSTFSPLCLNLFFFLSFSLLSSALFPSPVYRFSRVLAWLSPAQPVGPFDPFFLSLIPRSSRKYLLFPPSSRHFPPFSHLPLLF